MVGRKIIPEVLHNAFQIPVDPFFKLPLSFFVEPDVLDQAVELEIDTLFFFGRTIDDLADTPDLLEIRLIDPGIIGTETCLRKRQVIALVFQGSRPLEEFTALCTGLPVVSPKIDNQGDQRQCHQGKSQQTDDGP